MRVLVPHRFVTVPMGVRFGYFTFMRMIVVRIMHMAVFVLQFAMDMLMRVALGQMEPEANGHQHAGSRELRRQRLAQQQNGKDRADERRQREIGPGARRAQVAQAQHEHDKADPDAEKADNPGCRDSAEAMALPRQG